MKITKAYGKNLLIEPVVKSQILVAETASLCEYGVVTAIGDEVQKVKVGDMLAFKVWGIAEVDIDGKMYRFIPENSDFLLGYVEND